MPSDVLMVEEAKEEEAADDKESGFRDVTGKLKQPKRNRTPVEHK